MTATVAILGRPNVGKSTLFNRLVGHKIALVDDSPGVTRDRREGKGRLGALEFRIFDTAGLDEAKRGTLEARMSAQSEVAAKEADVLLFVIDARAGLTPTDKEFASRIRKLGKPVILLGNKSEARAVLPGLHEAYALGFGKPIAISAEHAEGLDELHDALERHVVRASPLPESDDEAEEVSEEYDPTRPLKLAIIGQPNAGKSTLVNAMLGEERMLTGPEAGITRDAISSEWQWQGRPIKLWDTAGIRRKSRVQTKIEKLSVSDALRAIRFAEPLDSNRARAIDRLGMGLLNKCVLRFDRPFWPKGVDWIDFLGTVDNLWADWTSYLTATGQPLLVGFNAAAMADEIEGLDDPATTASAMSALRTMFGSGIPDPAGSQISRWRQDPFAHGSYSFIPVGTCGKDRQALSGTDWDGRIAFAGEAASHEHPSTVHGALITGRQAARNFPGSP